jgi:hypothetical protein
MVPAAWEQRPMEGWEELRDGEGGERINLI